METPGFCGSVRHDRSPDATALPPIDPRSRAQTRTARFDGHAVTSATGRSHRCQSAPARDAQHARLRASPASRRLSRLAPEAFGHRAFPNGCGRGGMLAASLARRQGTSRDRAAGRTATRRRRFRSVDRDRNSANGAAPHNGLATGGVPREPAPQGPVALRHAAARSAFPS